MQMKMITGVGFLLCFVVGGLLGFNATSFPLAKGPVTPTPSTYQALRNSEIRGLDAETIEGYLAGAGMGLALPAELNGYPGPRHLLDLADDLALTPDQTIQVKALFDGMQQQAIAIGEQILAAEARLEQAFRDETIDDVYLDRQLTTIGDLQAQLRFVHLNTHLATIDILSQHQIVQYNALRGYESTPTDHQNHHP